MPETQSPMDRLSAAQLFSYPFRLFFLSLAVQAVLIVPSGLAPLPGDSISLWHYRRCSGISTRCSLPGFRPPLRVFS